MARTAAALVGLAVVGAGGYLFATPYISINQFTKAIETRDQPAIERFVDFPKLRSSLKVQLKARVADEITRQSGGNPWLSLGLGSIGSAIAEPMINAAVDTYVTPRGLKLLLAGTQPELGSSGTPSEPTAEQSPGSSAATKLSSGYKTPNLFVLSVRDASSSETVRFNFERHELVQWKLASVSLP